MKVRMDPAFLSLPSVLCKDFLTCKICYELYKSPKLLPCLHSYCLECLQLLDEHGSICCPECRLKVDVTNGVCSLRTNFFINSLLELFESKHVKDMDCNICLSKKAQTEIFHCIDCCDLSQTCTRGPSCSHPTLRHKAVDMKDFVTEHTKVKLYQIMCCQLHQQEPMRLFCDTCSTTICRECYPLCHSQHQVVCIADAIQKDRPEEKKVIEDWELTIHNISEFHKKVDEELERFRDADKNIHEHITRYVDKAIHHLLELKSTTFTELELLMKKNLEKCQSVKQTLERQRDQAVGAREMFLKVIENGMEYEKMCMADIMRSWIKNLQICAPQEVELQIPKLLISFEKDFPNIQLFSLVFPKVMGEDVGGTHSDQKGGLAGGEALLTESNSPIAGTVNPGDIFPVGDNITNDDCLPIEESSLVADTRHTSQFLVTGGTMATEDNLSEGDCLTENGISIGDHLPTKNILVTENTLPSGSIVATGDNLSTGGALDTGHELHSSDESYGDSLPFYESWTDESDWFDNYCGYGEDEGDWLDKYRNFGGDYSPDDCDSFDYDLSEISFKDENDWILNIEPPAANTKPQLVCSFRVNQMPNSGMPKITGIAVFSSGDILMADENNDDIKIFSTVGDLCECIILPEMCGQPPPCGITICGNTLVCSAGCYLIFMTLEGKLLHKVKLRGLQPQYAITAYKSNYVAVNEGTHCSVALYNNSGHYLGRVKPTGYQGGKFLFIAVSSREVFIVSDFFKKKIILFQKSGDIVNILDTSTPLLRDPFSICVDRNDHVFVVDQDRVLEFTPNGVFGRVVLQAEKTFEYPRVIAVDRQRRLIVVQKKDNANIVQL